MESKRGLTVNGHAERPIKEDFFSTAVSTVFASALALLTLVIYSRYTSPLTVSVGYDAAFFQLVGQGMADGYLPYRDFFDMKGPYLFAIECVSQLLVRGRMGVFIMQWILLSIAFAFGGKTIALPCKTAHGRIAAACVGSLLCAVTLTYTLEGGNLTEELSLPFIMASIYLNIRFLALSDDSKDVDYARSNAIAQGAIIAVLSMIRVTNAAPVLAMLLGVLVRLLMQRKIRNLFVSLFWFAFGLVMALLPIVGFYSFNGALEDMLYCVFRFGAMYSSGTGLVEHILGVVDSKLVVPVFLALTPVLVSLILHIRRPFWVFLSLTLCLSVITSLVLGNAYLHYGTLVEPLLFVSAFLVMYASRSIGRARDVAVTLVVILMISIQVPLAVQTTNSSARDITYKKMVGEYDDSWPAIAEIIDRIPESERDSVFCFGDDYWSRWYLMTGTYPAYKYLDWQNAYIALSPSIGEELDTSLADSPPTWLVLSPEGYGQISWVLDRYTFEYRNSKYSLYRLNG